uniref:SPX domain-containing protein n=2 Tax=Oryza TaxID=4527 RepID=A0A0E0PY73_ORYRU
MATIETHYHCYSLHQSTKRKVEEEDLQGERRPMVKFSKQFEGQLVPEWKDAFVDYWQLKKDIKRLQAAEAEAAGVAATTPLSQCQAPVAAAHWVMRLPFLHPHGHHHKEHVLKV